MSGVPRYWEVEVWQVSQPIPLSKRQMSFSRFEDGYEVRDYNVNELEKHMALYQHLVDRFVNVVLERGGGGDLQAVFCKSV